jgi:glycosyltransferase involved in cell wall biosynthesis
MDIKNQIINLLFETSWEVCNKIGGIYTVLSTKAQTLQNTYKDGTIFIGPDVWSEDNPSPFFTENDTKLSDWQAQTVLPFNLKVRVGRWNIPGQPIAILVKFDSLYADKDQFYGYMWNRFGVDSLHAYGDYDEGCAFARAAGIVIESIVNFYNNPTNVVAHFNEWTTGMGLLYVKDKLPHVATVFTTHATSIGRSICGNNKPLYDYLQYYNGDQMARELNMEAKHSLEKTAAHQADCFTTVSDVTARECEQLLERKPDIVTPNGFEKDFVPTKSKYTKARKEARRSLLNVASALTGIDFDDSTFIIATSGRCEYRNKGLDMFLDSLDRLRHDIAGRRLLAFVMVPAWSSGPRQDLQLAIEENIKSRHADPVLTHNLNNYNEDPINRRIHQLSFTNDVNSMLSVIYVPCYLNGTDGIFNKSYYELLPGLDATVFSSYYEPWGYTPLESIAFGVPTITTTLAGFGQWVLSTAQNEFSACGVHVHDRTDSNYDMVCNAIAHDIVCLMDLSDKEISKVRKAAMNMSDTAGWNSFISYYVEAYKIAINKVTQLI